MPFSCLLTTYWNARVVEKQIKGENYMKSSKEVEKKI